MVAQEKAEEQLLFNLCSSDNPLSNFAAIKQVSGIKRFYDEAQERSALFSFHLFYFSLYDTNYSLFRLFFAFIFLLLTSKLKQVRFFLNFLA